MLPDKDKMCHHTGFKVSCFEGVTEHSCAKWTHLAGKNPQTGLDFDRYGCADSFMPLLMIENTMRQNQTAAAIESFRNEMVRLNQVAPPLLLQD